YRLAFHFAVCLCRADFGLGSGLSRTEASGRPSLAHDDGAALRDDAGSKPGPAGGLPGRVPWAIFPGASTRYSGRRPNRWQAMECA
ncbi:MAG: hypothetical protein RIF44_15350, partial [Nitratireductor sp.]